MSKNIAKSPEMLQKEAMIASLKKLLKKRKTVLKGMKTRLSNTQQSIDDTQRSIQSQVLSKMGELDNLRLELIELAKELEKNENIPEEEKEQLLQMAEELTEEDLFGEGFNEYKAQQEAMENGEFEFEEEFRAKMNDAYAQFRVKPEEKEQRSIRNVFIKLSKKFHPDLASNPKETETFHSMMQQINEAYKNNDIQTLLELEQIHLIEEIDFSGKAITIDILDQEIKRFERDLDFINGQIDRLSIEIKDLRASNMGQMLTSMNKAEREGEGISTMVAELNNSIEQITTIRDGLKDSIKRGEISPILIKMMNPFAGTPLEHLDISPDMSPEDLMSQMMQKVMSGDVDPNEMLNSMVGMIGDDNPMGGGIFDMFGDDDDDDEDISEDIDDPDFPIDSHVRITKAVSHPYLKKLKMRNWEGTVLRAYYDEEDKEAYDILLDAHSLKQIPLHIIESMAMDDEDIRYYKLYRNQLASTKGKGSFQEDFTTFRTLTHRFKWGFLEDDHAERIKNAMLAHPNLSDVENWMKYLLPRFQFPFNVETLGILGPQEKLKVIDFAFVDEDYGIIMNIKQGRSKGTYPLADMEITGSSDSINAQLIEDYLLWSEDELEL